MKTSDLKDTWFRTGTKYDEFEMVVKELTDSTCATNIELHNLSLLSLDTEGPVTKDYTPLRAFTPSQTLERKPASRIGLKTSVAIEHGFTPELVEEIQRTSHLIVRYGSVMFPTSRGLARDLGARAGVSGPAVYEPSEERDSFFMSRYVRHSDTAVAVFRKGDTDNFFKLFALPSKEYCYIPQTFICSLLERFQEQVGRFECRSWYVDHTITQIWVDLPERAEDLARTYGKVGLPTPGLFIESSDTGDCSVRVIPTWRLKGKDTGLRGESWSRKHSGKFTIEDVLKGCESTVLSRYTKLPERLCELSLVECGNPQEVIETVLMDELKIRKVLGKKRAKELTDALMLEINPAEAYTAYDIAMHIMGCADRVKFSEGNMKGNLETLLYKAAFCDYEKIAEGGLVTLLSA